MRQLLAALIVIAMFTPAVQASQEEADRPIAIAIHGGAGTIRRAEMSPEMEGNYRRTMEQALRAGHKVLSDGGSSLDAVEATIHVLEDSPLFNAGRGAVMTAEGKCELDASIMEGSEGAAGAIAGATRIKNPITAARAVMEQTPHVFLAGPATDAFAEEAGLELVENDYFRTERRRKALEASQEREKEQGASILGMGEGRDDSAGPEPERMADSKFGTVGCVALDREGNLAAGTSTGGITNKRYGRVGDSPVIGAGTWAENETVAVSCTGQGEYFIRLQVAGDIAARMRYADASLKEAVNAQLDRLGELKAQGGVIAMDPKGNARFAFNTVGMYRGYIGPDGELSLAIYGDKRDAIFGADNAREGSMLTPLAPPASQRQQHGSGN